MKTLQSLRLLTLNNTQISKSKSKTKTKAHVHILGIAGIGMSGIAKLFHLLGYRVTGSDLLANSTTEALEELGIKCYQGHQEENLIQERRKGEDFALVCSSAIDISPKNKNPNPEVRFVLENKLNLYTRAEALAEIAKYLSTIAVSGTHGKTTTTSLINHLLSAAGLEPSFLIGGLPRNVGKNAELGSSDWFVVEADESDGTFLYLRPHIAVITNIDHDHLEFYEHQMDKLKSSFVQFVRNLGINDYAIVCAEDENVVSIMHLLHRNLITYGFKNHCTIYAQKINQQPYKCEFIVKSKRFGLNEMFEIKLPGEHNILNSLAAIAAAKLAGIETEIIHEALAQFEGVKRRFEPLGQLEFQAPYKSIQVIDDYAHHPKEIGYTLKAAQNRFAKERVFAIFQAHRYSRTHDLLNDFASTLALADELVLLPIYSAGEVNHYNVHNQDLVRLIQQLKPDFKVSQIKDDEFNPLSLEQKAQFLKNFISNKVKSTDVIVSMGAGTIRSIVETMVNLKG